MKILAVEMILDANVKGVEVKIDSSIIPTKDVNKSIMEPMKITPLKVPQRFKDQIIASYDEICVLDYGDMYHMSEEERKATTKYYDAFKEIKTMKIKHRSLDTFVIAYRMMMKCLRVVADDNGIYDPDKFVSMVLRRKIHVNGLKIPKYNGKGKKEINWELVGEYILDPTLDPKDLVKKKHHQFYEVTTEDDIAQLELMIGNDVGNYLNSIDDISPLEAYNFRYDEDDTSQKNLIVPASKKDQRRFVKSNKAILYGIRQVKRDAAEVSSMRSWAFDMTQDAYEEVRERNDKFKGDKIPKFKGNILNKDEYRDYLEELEAYERSHTKVEYNGRYYSMDDYDELLVKEYLDSCGLNIRNFETYRRQEEENKKRMKKYDKHIKNLKKRLAAAEERREERESRGGVNHKKKKKGKKSKKENKKLKSELKPDRYDDFNSYRKAMEGWDDDDE